jgi:hypothetical protein
MGAPDCSTSSGLASYADCDEMQKDACNCEILVEVNEVDMARTMQTLSMIMGVAGSGRQAKPRDDRRINGR